MRLRQPTNRMTDLEANQGGRSHQSLLHVLREENEILYCCRPGNSTKSRFLPSARAAKTGGFGRLGLLPDLSSDLLVAATASRGVRYDKYFAIGKFSHLIFSPGYCRSMRAGNNLVSLPIFFLAFLPAMVF